MFELEKVLQSVFLEVSENVMHLQRRMSNESRTMQKCSERDFFGSSSRYKDNEALFKAPSLGALSFVARNRERASQSWERRRVALAVNQECFVVS